MIIWEMFHGRMSLDSVLLLPLVNFVSGFRLGLMHISLIESIRSSLIHLHGCQLLAQLRQFVEITFFISTNRLNLQNPKQSSCRLGIVAKGFLKLPNLHMIIKQKSPSLPRNLDFWQINNNVLNKSKSAIPLFNAQECCLLHLIKQNCLLKTF